MHNIGATCYLGAATQVALASVPLRTVLREGAASFVDGGVTQELARVAAHMWGPPKAAWDPTVLRLRVARRSPNMELMPLTPHDTTIALRTMLDDIIAQLDAAARASLVTRTTERRQCVGPNCAGDGGAPTTAVLDAHPMLHPIAVPEQADAIGLPALLDRSAAPRVRGCGAEGDPRCDGCKCVRCPPTRTACTCGKDSCSAASADHTNQPVGLSFTAWPPPEVTFISLNRTRWDSATGRQTKVKTRVRLPQGTFALERIFAEPVDGNLRATTVHYRVIAAAFHAGDTPRDGHYWASVCGTAPDASLGFALANDAGVLRGSRVPPAQRPQSDVAARRVALVAIERVDSASVRVSLSERRNRLAEDAAPEWLCTDGACGHSNDPRAAACARCRHWPCPACTTRNADGAGACAVCGKGRAADRAAACWVCSRCTLRNYDALLCLACGKRCPPLVAIVVRRPPA